MPLEDIQIYEMDRASSKLEHVRTNPTRQWLYVSLGPDGKWTGTPALIWWQNGAWYDTGGNEIPEADVPEHCKKELAANPVTVTSQGPAVTWVCKFCHEKMNQSEQEAHLLKHMDDVMKSAGTFDKGERQVTAKNTHRPGA